MELLCVTLNGEHVTLYLCHTERTAPRANPPVTCGPGVTTGRHYGVSAVTDVARCQAFVIEAAGAGGSGYMGTVCSVFLYA